MLREPQEGCLAIGDISGYTGLLADTELEHAQDALRDLIRTVVDRLRGPFRLAKLEGDAAFVYSPVVRIDGSLLLDTLESAYFAFRRRLDAISRATTCECNACIRIPSLNLKFVTHHGRFVVERLYGEVISQGQSNGFPVYRQTWQTMGSLHRMFRWCNTSVRAEPYPFGADAYVNLELYLAWRGRGLPVETPAVRR